VTTNGPVTLALVPESSDAMVVNTRENATNKPELVITRGSGGTIQDPPTEEPTEPATSATTFEPVADASVRESQPTTNKGTSITMIADTSPQEVSYIRFDVQTGGAAISTATLRLYVSDSTSDAPAIATSNDVTWSETGITWNTRPAVGTPGPDHGAASKNTWIEYDVTSLVTGDGPITLVLVPQSSNGMDVHTRENATNKPQLVITTAGTSGARTLQRTAAPAAASDSLTDATDATPQATPTAATNPTPAEAATTTGTVTGTGGEGVRMRIEPSADAVILTIIPEGETVTIRGPREGEWLPVAYSGQEGYVAAQFIAVNDGTTPAPSDAATPSATTDVPMQPTETATVTDAPTEATPPPTEVIKEPVATPSATPLPVAGGWQSDINQPWTSLTDGDPATTWSASIGLPPEQAEVGYDLGSVIAIEKLRLLPIRPLAGTVEVQLSADGTTWYHLTSLRLDERAPDEWFDLPAGYSARYTRFIVTNPTGAPTTGALAEIEIWAEPTGNAQPLEQLQQVTPTPVPTEAPAPTDVPMDAAPVAPASAAEPTPEPTVDAPPAPAPPAAETPAEDTQPDPASTPEGSVNGT